MRLHLQPKVYSLHPNYQGGDNYFSTFGSCYHIIFQEKGTYRITTDLHKDTNGVEYKLHPSCRNGLYYWGMPNRCFFLMPVSDWGVEFCGSKDISKDQSFGVYSVHPDILNFLPGGLSITKGPAFGIWENIKTIMTAWHQWHGKRESIKRLDTIRRRCPRLHTTGR